MTIRFLSVEEDNKVIGLLLWLSLLFFLGFEEIITLMNQHNLAKSWQELFDVLNAEFTWVVIEI